MKKSGFILLLGETNSGKSTFINNVVGDKVSIVSHKVQTTRFRVLGILTKEENQFIFIDTPGIFNPRRNRDKEMLKTSFSQVKESDIIIFLIDSKKGLTKNSEEIIKKLPKDKKVICVLNKTDLVAKENLLDLSNKLSDLYNFDRYFMISALKNKGINDILIYLSNNIKKQDWFFEEDQISDLPISKLATEITREKIYNFLHKELPYNIEVKHISWQEDDVKIIIHQNICIVKKSYKGIILGKKGEKIKQIRVMSEKEIEKLFSKKVQLNLYIKVEKSIDKLVNIIN